MKFKLVVTTLLLITLASSAFGAGFVRYGGGYRGGWGYGYRGGYWGGGVVVGAPYYYGYGYGYPAYPYPYGYGYVGAPYPALGFGVGYGWVRPGFGYRGFVGPRYYGGRAFVRR